jgi:GAF domain-containing protein
VATQDLVTRTLVELADTLVDDFDVVELFNLLTDRCCEALGVSDAGLMLAAPIGGELRLMASSSIIMRDLELYELQASEGPCLDCYRSGTPVENEQLGTARQRWPRFATAALDAGFHSVTALPMRLRGATIGALNLFRTDTILMSDSDLAAARAFADVATIAILQHQAAVDAKQVNEQLHYALNSRIIIEQAKGMLAERANLDVDEAFNRLRNHARNHNLRIADVAEDFLHGNVTIEQVTALHHKSR